jgi:hypothetical protein
MHMAENLRTLVLAPHRVSFEEGTVEGMEIRQSELNEVRIYAKNHDPIAAIFIYHQRMADVILDVLKTQPITMISYFCEEICKLSPMNQTIEIESSIMETNGMQWLAFYASKDGKPVAAMWIHRLDEEHVCEVVAQFRQADIEAMIKNLIKSISIEDLRLKHA